MIFENHILTKPPLDKHVESILYFKNIPLEYSIERLVPTGHIFIIFEFDGLTRSVFDNQTLKPIQIFNKVWISGMHHNFISISAHNNSEMFVIQFKPTGALPFLHFPLQNITDKVMAADDLLGLDILTLRTHILEAETIQAKFRVAENWLSERYDKQKEPTESFLNFIQILQKEPVAKFNEIVKTYPHTQKQLIQHFIKYIGLRPKYYQRILRFNEILQKIKSKENLTWTDISYNCGYSDQSHFIKEFTLFCGFNPSEFIKQDFEKDKTNFFPLDRKG